MSTPMKLALLLGLFPLQGLAEPQAQLSLHSTVSGQQEQPTVMYIVPWQQAKAPELQYELHSRIAADLYRPIDRDEFVRGLVLQSDLAAQRNTKTLESNDDRNL